MQLFRDALQYNPEQPLIFYSVLFFILFSVFYLVYSIGFKHLKIRNILLLAFSLFFYYKISGLYVILLVLMGSSDYLIGLGMSATQSRYSRKLYLLLSLSVNLGSLLFFKYTNFFLHTWFSVTAHTESPVILQLAMPLGISYYVFKTLTYILDLYWGILEKPEKRYLNYLLYVSFFPNILAGPISKARDLLPQFQRVVALSREQLSRGFLLVMTGVFKKIVIADYLAANLVDRVFDAPDYFTGFEALIAAVGAMFQLYYDFSGYTDIVIGIACLLGFEIEANFNQPFISRNITEFWRRWHITLSNWLREYLFTPLSMLLRRWMMMGSVIALFTTFFLSGLWHGPALTFVAWGALHGLALSWDIVTRRPRAWFRKVIPSFLYNGASNLLTLAFLALTVILIKVKDLNAAVAFWKKIFTDVDFSLAGQWISLYVYPFLVLACAAIFHYLPRKWISLGLEIFTKTPLVLKIVLMTLFIVLVYQVYSVDSLPFIYLSF